MSALTARLGALVVSLLLAPAAARADVVLGVELPTFDYPLANAISRGEPSSLTVKITNNGTQIVRQVDFEMAFVDATHEYTATGGISPDATWSTPPAVLTAGLDVIRFTTGCSSPGIVPGDSATFVIQFTSPELDRTQDSNSSAFHVTGSTSVCESPAVTSPAVAFTAPVKSLYMTGSLQAAGISGVTVTWRVTNNTSPRQDISVIDAITPSTGCTRNGNCTTLPRLRGYTTGEITCTYTCQTPGTYTFTASARNDLGDATAAGATAGTFHYGTSPLVSWTKPVVVQGLDSNTLTLTVTAGSGNLGGISRVDVFNDDPADWTLAGGSADNLLNYSATSTPADVVFTGALARGESSSLAIHFSAVPGDDPATTTYPFRVRMTYGNGSSTVSQPVTLVVPIADVEGLTIRADDAGQLLQWRNAPGVTPAGVVVFRSPAGTAPGIPTPFRTYTAGSNGVVYAGSGASAFPDSIAVGNYNYRVCNHDQYHVYSSCSTGFWNGQGWLDSGAYPVQGAVHGWVHSLGGDARVHAGLLGTQIALASNIPPSVTIVDLATGERAFPPTPIAGLPAVYTPAVPLHNGDTVLFAADQDGYVTAVNLADGSEYWPPIHLDGQSFTGGITGILWLNASDGFQGFYADDVLLLGSTTGLVYALDAVEGRVLWSFDAGAPIYGLLNYDSLTDLFWVPTSAALPPDTTPSAGVLAYHLLYTDPPDPPLELTWRSPDVPPGSYPAQCTRLTGRVALACVDATGVLRLFNKETGALLREFETSLTTEPTAVIRVAGTAAQTGVVVASATEVQVLSIGGGPSYAVQDLGTFFAPATVTLSDPAVYADRGYLVVGGSDRLYRVSLLDALDVVESAPVLTQATSLSIGRPILDTANTRFLFGTSDGHLYSIPVFP